MKSTTQHLGPSATLNTDMTAINLAAAGAQHIKMKSKFGAAVGLAQITHSGLGDS